MSDVDNETKDDEEEEKKMKLEEQQYYERMGQLWFFVQSIPFL